MPKEKTQISNDANKTKPRVIQDIDRDKIKSIVAKAKRMREELGYSYESFALHAEINRNTYFRFEKSATKGENITVALLLKVIRGLNLTVSDFFKDIK